VLSGPHAGRTFTFDQHNTFLIGRSESAHLCLPEDRFFSRNHCILEINPPRCYLRDLGSTNGTYVNGQKVQEAFLNSGDQIQGGQTVLAVEVSADQTVQGYSGTHHGSGPTVLPQTQPSLVMVECLNCGRRDQAEASRPDERLTYLCEDCRIELKRQPQQVPGYDTIKILGRGGMGCVMLARNQQNGQLVAIKTMLPEVAVSEQSLRRFMREIDVAATLQHPNIVRFVDRGSNNGVVYLVTEFVEGADAAKLADMRGGRLPYREAALIVSQALDALAYAHTQGYIHRDIKDQNILVSGSWPNYTSKLTDFGLAKSFTQSGMSGITMAGDMAGTFAYMPPEQIRDFRDVRPAADIYAMGMTAYSLVTGALALDISPKANVAETVKAIFDKPIIPLNRHTSEVPPAFAAAIERALAKDPLQRWPTAESMRKALMSAL
jgi:eukaryotic-like serine/threonine-protein kinase